MQEAHRQHCLFGCWGRRHEADAEDDDFRHCLECPRLGFVINQAAAGIAGPLHKWLLRPSGAKLGVRKRLAARVAAALHVHRSLRLTTQPFALDVNGEPTLEHRTLREHLGLMQRIATSAAHKFAIARGGNLCGTG